jgi:hypothetical protein
MILIYELMSETRHYEEGIASNRKSGRYGEVKSRWCTNHSSSGKKNLFKEWVWTYNFYNFIFNLL